MIFEFREDIHEYKVDGVRVPSVTEILREWIEIEIYGTKYFVNINNGVAIPSEQFRRLQEFGRAVHKGGKFILKGLGLNWSALADSLKESLKQLQKWVEEFRAKPVLVEEPLYSKIYGYAGTPDFIGHIKGNKFLTIVDIGTGMLTMKGYQTSAYEQLFRENERYRGKIERVALSVPRNGDSYKPIPLNNRKDWKLFYSKFYIWKEGEVRQ